MWSLKMTLVLCLSISANADGAFALARSPTGSGFAFSMSVDQPSAVDAQGAALIKCNEARVTYGVSGTCEIVENYTDQCVALAHSPNGANGYVVRDTKSEAETVAMKACSDYRGINCQLAGSTCDGIAY